MMVPGGTTPEMRCTVARLREVHACTARVLVRTLPIDLPDAQVAATVLGGAVGHLVDALVALVPAAERQDRIGEITRQLRVAVMADFGVKAAVERGGE